MLAALVQIANLLVSVAIGATAQGLQLTLIPLRAVAEGFSPFELGALGSAYFVGFVAAGILIPHLLISAGHIRVFAAMMALAAATILFHVLIVAFPVWLLFRLVMGACLASFYLIIESWLNDRATNQNRGVMMSTFVAINFTGITIGQVLLSIFPATTFVPFAIASAMFSLATIPIALSRAEQPKVAIARFRPIKVFRLSPVGMIAVACGGLINGALWAFAPVFAIGKGATPSEAALFMSMIMIGGALSLIVLGRFSDRMDRRVLLLFLMLAGVVASLLLTASPGGLILFAFAFAYGIAALPIYATASAHTYDLAAAGDYVETAASLMVANGLASILGPVIAAVVVSRAGSGAFFLLVGAIQLALAVFILVRLRARPAPVVKAPLDLATAAIPPEATVGDIIVDRNQPRPG